MSKVVSVVFPLVLLVGSLSAQAKEVELLCFTLKGHPHGTKFIIDTHSQRIWSNDGISNKQNAYQVISWSPQKILFNDQPSSIRSIWGYMSYSIDRVNLDFFWYKFNKDGQLENQLFGKCELPRTQPYF
jgi:hypothetical protein